MTIAATLRRSIAVLAVTGSLLAGGVATASQSQAATQVATIAANTRLGTVDIAAPNNRTPARQLNARGYAECVKTYGNRVRGAKLRSMTSIQTPKYTLYIYTYVCWAR